jgi:hypothetical protein
MRKMTTGTTTRSSSASGSSSKGAPKAKAQAKAAVARKEMRRVWFYMMATDVDRTAAQNRAHQNFIATVDMRILRFICNGLNEQHIHEKGLKFLGHAAALFKSDKEKGLKGRNLAEFGHCVFQTMTGKPDYPVEHQTFPEEFMIAFSLNRRREYLPAIEACGLDARLDETIARSDEDTQEYKNTAAATRGETPEEEQPKGEQQQKQQANQETIGAQQPQEPVKHEAPSTPTKKEHPDQKKQKTVLSATSRRLGADTALKAGGVELMTQFLTDTMTPASAAPDAAATTTTAPAAAATTTTAPAAAATTTTAPGRAGVCRFFPKGTCKNGTKCTYTH